jgi:hypothetical protein
MSREEVHRLNKRIWAQCHHEDVSHLRDSLLESEETRKDSHCSDIAFRAGETCAEVVRACIGEFDSYHSNSSAKELSSQIRASVIFH